MKVRITPRDMEAVRALIDGAAPDPFVPGFSYDGTDLMPTLSRVPPNGYVKLADLEATRKELGKAHFALDIATEHKDTLKKEAAAREDQYACWLHRACRNRDLAQRNATRWKLCSWAFFLLLVVAITFRWSGR